MTKLVSPDEKPRILPPVHPNVGVTVAYRQKLDKLIARMQKSIVYWLRAQYRANPPEMALDASPAVDFLNLMRRIWRRWSSLFDEAAEQLGEWFGRSVQSRSDAALKTILKDAGWSVEFKITRPMNDVLQATIGQQVSLIKSIGQQHLSQVEQLVMRSVQQGRNLGELTKELEQRYNLTRKRASLIARDQNNKATAMMMIVRQHELGIDQAIWLHSGGGKEPRKDHVAFSAGRYTNGPNPGPYYDVKYGAKLDDGWIFPGELINCRCVTRSVIPGLQKSVELKKP